MENARKRKESKSGDAAFVMAPKVSKEKRRRYVDSAADTVVAQLFGKRFDILDQGHPWELPEHKTWFTEEPWKIVELQVLKNDLNATKSKLDDYDLTEWSRHTRRRNRAGQVQWKLRNDVRPEFLTQAWCKFYENACRFPLIPDESLKRKSLESVHLCEAPGAFVAALNHWLNLNVPDIRWKWLATALNPHYEGNSPSRMVDDDRLMTRTPENWFFGIDDTGDLLNLQNLDALVRRAGQAVNLVTADGSIDCLDSPAEQERLVSQLHYCQVVAALHLLEKGANFLLKVFTIFEHRTVCLIYLLSCCFDRVSVNKPVTSKEGNSEVYVVCLGFAGPNLLAPCMPILRENYESPSEMAIFRRSDVPDSFVERIVRCGEFFKAHQCEVILNNMRTFGRNSAADDVNGVRRIVAERFIEHYNLRPLPSEKLRLVARTDSSEPDFSTLDPRAPLDSYNSRRRREKLSPDERLTMIVENLESIGPPDAAGCTFELSDIPDKLRISTGRPYTRIETSKFCKAAVLKMYNKALDIKNDMGFTEFVVPSPETVQRYGRENSDSRKLLNFGYTGLPDSHEFITRVCRESTNLERNENLTLLGYSLLSRLNVGVLCILARTFDSVELLPSEDLGCTIRLKKYIKVERITEFLREISDASIEAKRNGRAVLSVLPISMLRDSPLYRRIVEINHWVMRHCVIKFDDYRKLRSKES